MSESDPEAIDVSQWDFPADIWLIKPNGESIVKVATILPVVLIGVLGNGLLLNIISRNRALRTPTNFLLANMAAADLVTLIFCPVMFICKDLFQIYQLGAIGCKLEGFIQAAFLITAVLSLCAVSYDRLTAIALPMESRVTMRGAKIVMTLTWLAGFALSTPLAFYRTYRERQWRNFLETFCRENPVILPVYWHVIITAIVWCPLAVMIVCYTTIFWKLDRYEAQVLKRETPISVSYKTRVAKMLFIVVVTFVILRIPFTALIFIRNKMLLNDQSVGTQVEGSFATLWYISHYLLYLNSAVNPIIYGLTNDNFRRAYLQTPFSFNRLWTNATNAWRSDQRTKTTKRNVSPASIVKVKKNREAQQQKQVSGPILAQAGGNNSNGQTLTTVI